MHPLVKGQNLPWPGDLLRVELAAGDADLSLLILGADGAVRSSDDLIFYNQPSGIGAQWFAGPPQRLEVTASRLTGVRAVCVLSLDPGSAPCGAGPPPTLRLSNEAGLVAEFTATGLTTELALIGCELYQRDGRWKVRAVGQGYDGGLAALVRAHGVEVDDEPAPAPTPAPPSAAYPPPSQPATAHPTPSPPAPAGPLEEARAALEAQQRMFTVSTAIMEDASRSTASLRSTREFAENRLHADLERLVHDPRLRHDPAGAQAREQAHRHHDELIATASANHRRDMDQLAAEVAQWKGDVVLPMAEWSRWPRPWVAPAQPALAVKLGDLGLEEAPELAIPYLLRVPFARPLVIDAAAGGPVAARAMLRSVLTRVLACYLPGRLVVHTIDPGGTGSPPLAPIGAAGCTVQTDHTATSLAQITTLLEGVSAHVDRYEMAAQAGMLDAVDARDQLVVLTDFPTGLDDRCLGLLRHLLATGPAVGIGFLMVTASQDLSEPLAAGILNASQRVPATTGGRLTDRFGGVDWEFRPDLGPEDPGLLEQVLARISAGR
ncbi:MAG: TerD family protein [Actinomycetales bacterium]